MKGSTARSGRAGADDKARKGDLARIHCLKRDLGLDTDLYRDMLWTVARVNSSAELDSHGRAAVIAHMQARLPAARKAGYPGRPHNTDAEHRAELLKIEALLTDAGKPWAYAEGLLKHMTRGRKLKLEFASGGERAAIIAALHKAAVKRLSAELKQQLGEGWEDYAGHIAAYLFGFPSLERNVASYPQTMSQVARWWRGELAVSCQWPARDDKVCCVGCAKRTGLVP